jgi:hypothetical protein
MGDFYYWKRELLYAEVWEQPVTKVAEKYGVSDVAIAKLCRRLRVPVPGRGYWARKEAGRPPKQKPLPPFKDPPVIVFRKHVRSPKPQMDSSDPELSKIAEVEGRTIPVPTVEHKLVEKARRVLERARTDEYERTLHPPSSPCLDVHVRKALLERAFSVMNAIVFALEAEGLQVKVGETSTSVEVFGQNVAFGIEEDLQLKERREVKSYSSTRLVNVYECSGNLSFRVWTSTKGNRAHWGDGKTQRLEDLFPRCIGGIFRHARYLRIEHEAQRQRELEWERERLEAAERARKAREEEEKLRNLETCIANWTKAQQIRTFVEAYEKMSASMGEPIGPESSRGQWIKWARQKADWYDPLVEQKE